MLDKLLEWIDDLSPSDFALLAVAIAILFVLAFFAIAYMIIG